MGKKSKTKGKSYEREVANDLKAFGYTDCHRTSQFCGKPTGKDGEDASDVVGLPGIHIECKHYATKQFDYAWLDQAIRDSEGTGNLPTVFHRVDRRKTVVTMRMEDFLAMYEAYNKKTTKKRK